MTSPSSPQGANHQARVAELEELKEKAESLERQLQCAETHVAAARAENTRLNGELARITAVDEKLARQRNAALRDRDAALAANTPLHTTAAHAGCPEGECEIKRTIEQLGGQLLRVGEVLTECGYTDEQARVAAVAILDEPRAPVTGTTSDSAPEGEAGK